MIQYSLCVNSWLYQKFQDTKNVKYKYLNMELNDSNIKIFNGVDLDYLKGIMKWINSI